ncbi:MAG: cupin domain-containing protein [Hyphomicrobiaceae bacterium]|nr:cupin domain-containing protein [Hyphomicrobiaceae bacterium]MCC0023537.1 cupin domain-containing protein [Hyphomicrobiaceae bacterium]
MSDLKKPVRNIADVPLRAQAKGSKFQSQFGSMTQMLGSRPMGASLTVVEPGKTAFPLHNHHVTAEMFYIIEGEGSYRVGEETYPVKAGDVIASPPGGRETAHQISNTGASTLKYLGFSANSGETDVVEYPDSDKFAVSSRFDWATGKSGIRFVGRTETSLDYWDGEDIGEDE